MSLSLPCAGRLLPGRTGSALVGVLLLGAGGCSTVPGATLETPTAQAFFGISFSPREARAERYTFSRARLAVAIEGTSVPQRRAGRPAGFTHTLTLTVAQPKFNLDPASSARLTREPGDPFEIEFDSQRRLTAITAIPSAGAPPTIARAGIPDLSAVLTSARPAGPMVAVATSTGRDRLQPFRHEAEVDPASAGEIAVLQAELERLAKGWGLRVDAAAVPVTATVMATPVTLAPAIGARCLERICFRLPIPYRLTVTPAVPSGWSGRAETLAWLPNDGPFGHIDVKSPSFSDGGVRATFDNGMLRSILARDMADVAAVLRLPGAGLTSATGR